MPLPSATEPARAAGAPPAPSEGVEPARARTAWAPSSPWAQRAVIGLFAIALVALLKAASALLVPITAALVLTFVFQPMVRWLRRRNVPETIGAGVVVAALLVATGGLTATLIEPATEWWERAPETLSRVMARVDRLRAVLPILAPAHPAPVVVPVEVPPRPPARRRPAAAEAAAPAAAAASQPPASDPIAETIATQGVALTGAFVSQFLAFCLSASATVILLYFLLASEHWVLSRSVEAIPRQRARALMLAGLRSVQREISHFLGALAVVNLGVGAAMVGAAWLLGLPNPVLWGTVCGILNFIPYLGPVIGSVLLTMAGVLTFDTVPQVLAPAAALLIIHAVEANFVSPIFVGRRLSLSPVFMCLSVMFWGWLWGIAGAVMAVPILVALRALTKRQRRLRLLTAYLEGTRRPVRSLRALMRPKRPKAGGAAAG
ncbi:AI-2E family transporter [Ideonella sp.]|uniref:AI-2E family transporter n=1 Tax=Ideonella sp. TaxID=1929293 RepID=UPI0035B15DBE